MLPFELAKPTSNFYPTLIQIGVAPSAYPNCVVLVVIACSMQVLDNNAHGHCKRILAAQSSCLRQRFWSHQDPFEEYMNTRLLARHTSQFLAIGICMGFTGTRPKSERTIMSFSTTPATFTILCWSVQLISSPGQPRP